MSSWQATLYTQSGRRYDGWGFGAKQVGGGELVFNTGMTGYQEIFTDPSYSRQIVLMTYPELGNTGVNPQDIENEKRLYLSGVAARNYCPVPSNYRSTETLSSYLSRYSVPGIYGLDTRALTRDLRSGGAENAVIFPTEMAGKSVEEFAKRQLDLVPSMEGLDLVSEVTCDRETVFRPDGESVGTVMLYDYGAKTNIIRSFLRRRFQVRVVPATFPFQEILKASPEAVVLSNGPGDPGAVQGAVEQIQGLVGKVPIFAVCMGHQLLARALGASTFKMKFGHHGINHPVQDRTTGRILITSQNHGFAVREEDLKKLGFVATHVSLNDGTVEGMVSEKDRFYSLQFHPEAKPGPNDADVLFDQFLRGFVK